ncbi:hypothetical protein DIPPA_28194 [Diplonema papillatum]|nr:hypothetical protein DIPPA_28194 [Diplonema papillatum]
MLRGTLRTSALRKPWVRRMQSLGPEYAAPDDASFVRRYRASCYCGEVKYDVRADPVDAKVCHCKACQKLHGAPMQWAAIFHKKDVRLISGFDSLRFYNSENGAHTRTQPCKVSCSQCGSLVADEGRRMWLSFPSLFDFEGATPAAFKPTCHIFYGARVFDVNDGLPKWAGHKDSTLLS